MKSFIRYPGGKSKHVRKILRYLRDAEPSYREPFVGGGSVYLSSKFENAWINDKDLGVYDLWRQVKEDPEFLIKRIKTHSPIINHNKNALGIELAISLWKEIKNDTDNAIWSAGYRCLFLSKTCFSGIISGGPTGGMHQSGKYTLGSRWSAGSTIKRIRVAHNRLQSCRITNLPWEQVFDHPGDNLSFYLDPPYLEKGKQCYGHSFTLEDHIVFAKRVSKSLHRYVVTVDDCPELRTLWQDLVPEHLIFSENWSYSMTDYRKKNRKGKEMFIVDQDSYDLMKAHKVANDLFA